MILRRVEERIRSALSRLWPDADITAVRVEAAREKGHGDLATNAALVLAKQLRRAPLDIAADIVADIESDPLFLDVEIAPPGFVNCRVTPAAWRELLGRILLEGDRFGTTKEGEGRREQVEFVSANPTGPLNVVSARAAAVGDTLASLLEATGIDVEREFYVNDFGSQVDHLVESVAYFLDGEKGEFPENGYRGAYVADLAGDVAANLAPLFRPGGEENDDPGAAALEEWVGEIAAGEGKGDSSRNAPPLPEGRKLPLAVSEKTWRALLRRWVLEKMLEGQREDLASFGVSFDSWYRESRLHGEGKVEETLAELEKTGDVYEKGGAWWFRSSKYGDDDDRVIRRSDGRPSYFLADIAYHREKALRGFDRAIDILGPDHHGHIARMEAAMEALGRKKGWLEVFIVQQVNLVRGGKPVKMSKRAGEFVTLRNLIDEVGVDAARFFFLMLRPNTHLNFDMELATKKSLDNPVYYVQYAHARVCSVFRHAEAAGIGAGTGNGCLDLLDSPDDIELIRFLDPFPGVVASAARHREPQRLGAYLKELAATFHTYYHKVKVVGPQEEITLARLALLEGVRTVLRNGLRLLGVSAPDSM